MLVWRISEGWQDKGQAVGLGCMVGFSRRLEPSLAQRGGAFLKKRLITTAIARSPCFTPASAPP